MSTPLASDVMWDNLDTEHTVAVVMGILFAVFGFLNYMVSGNPFSFTAF